MKEGFFPALGTPLDADNRLNENSYGIQISRMIDAGASGLLCMGSMGNMSSIRDEEYPEVAEACVRAALGKVPVMVGVMDNSVSRVMDRIYSLGDLGIEGVVATTPFYYKCTDEQIYEFFMMLADESYYPLYIYDLPVVTQSPVSTDVLRELMKEDNIKGIKTANYDMITEVMGEGVPDGFEILFSGLDIFDKAIFNGIRKNLDGMFTATPLNTGLMYKAARENNSDGVSEYLGKIVRLRDEFVKSSVFTAYSYAMNLLGMPGIYQPDYHGRVKAETTEGIRQCMKEIGELE